METEKTDPKPMFIHDCNECVFLGTYKGFYDLYFCGKGIPTVIARFGNDGPDYHSGLYLAGRGTVLGEAKKRAVEKGLLNGGR